jgi:hypothetical protein
MKMEIIRGRVFRGTKPLRDMVLILTGEVNKQVQI